MPDKNSISQYGKPIVGILISWAGLFGFVLAVGGEQFRARWAVTLCILFVHWVIITYLIWMVAEFRKVSFAAPTVKNLQLEDKILLVTPKDWLGMSVAVLVYVQEDSYERLLCAGVVINQQGNGLIQIKLDVEVLEQEQVNMIHQKLTSSDLGRIVIKPGQG